jgi:hypothetical protein
MIRTNRLQLISIHIPKTAGTSFRNTLKGVYGEHAVKRLDIDLIHQQLKVEQETFTEKKLPRGTKVIHGHFSYALLSQQLEISPKTPVITWLRDPVERVISNYHYLAKRLAAELNEEGKGLNILSKMQKTLLEYAYSELNRNRISKFMEGMSLSDCAFVGITECYQQDLASLSQLLNWKSYPNFHHNATGQRPVVSEMEREVIRSWNQADMALYEEALSLRQARIKAQVL